MYWKSHDHQSIMAMRASAASTNPLSLASALRKLEGGNRQVALDANPGTAHPFIVHPLYGGEGALFCFQPIPRLESIAARY